MMKNLLIFSLCLVLSPVLNSQNDPQYLKLPVEMQANWFNPRNGEWILGIHREKVAYKGDLWDLTSIEASNDQYQVELQKSDTICYYNAAGNYVCEWRDRQARLQLSAEAEGQLLLQDDKRQLMLTDDYQSTTYRPTEALPATFEPGFAVFKGWVINADQEQIDEGISLYVNDLYYADQAAYSSPIDEDGYFYLKIPMTTAQDLYIRPGRSIFLEPGKTLVASINAAKKGDIRFMGAHAELNRDLTLFNRDPGNRFPFRKDRKNYKLPPEEYKVSRRQLQDNYLEDFRKYTATQTVSSSFTEWFYINTELRYYSDLIDYCQGREKYADQEAIVHHPTYFSFISELDINDARYQISGNLRAYVHELYYLYRRQVSSPFRFSPRESRFLQALLDQEKELSDTQRDTINAYLSLSKGNEYQPTTAEALWFADLSRRYGDRYQETMQRAWLDWCAQELYPLFAEHPNANALKQYQLLNGLNQAFSRGLEKNINVYWPKVTALELELDIFHHLQYRYDQVLTRIKTPLQSYANIKAASASSADELLQEIARNHRGQIVYLDVWATWCQPCHQEMQKSGPMKKAFKQRDIAIVYLCADGQESVMQDAIKRYDLAGDHYFMSAKTSREFRALFDISAYPTYLIMNHEGQVVNRQAPRPSNLPTLLWEIDRLK